MTMALTKARAWGIEVEEPVNKRYMQYLRLQITGANTNVDYDFGDNVAGSLGTFWTAVGATEPGTTAMTAIRDIVKRAEAYLWAAGTGLSTRTAEDASRTVVQALTSAAYGGGSATPTLTVTGLLTTDTILGATQILANSNSKPLIGAAATCAVADAYIVAYASDPGTTGTVRVLFSRATTTPEAGTYIQSIGDTLAPNILFASGDAPTTMDLTLCWMLRDGQEPVSVTATSAAQTAF